MSDENKLIRQIVRRGSREAADALIRLHYDEIYVFMYRQVGQKEDALDLTQECFLAVLRGLSSFDEKKASFRTWLYRIATNKVIDKRRGHHMTTVPLDEETLPEKEDIAGNIQDKLLLGRVDEWVAGQDPLLQKIYRMHIYTEMTFKEIGDVMQMSEDTVKTKYYRLMKKLRKEFQND